MVVDLHVREFAHLTHRPGRGRKDALRRVEELLSAGNTQVVDVDIKGYFDTIPMTGRWLWCASTLPTTWSSYAAVRKRPGTRWKS
jgi:hypothetical protein